MEIYYESKGGFPKTLGWLKRLNQRRFVSEIEAAAAKGTQALAAGTPKRTGATAASWSHKVLVDSSGVTVEWYNDSKTYQGDPIVLLIQYGHGTGTGGYVRGRDFINPIMQPVFDEIEMRIVNAIKEA